jgi:hypothetical protein
MVVVFPAAAPAEGTEGLTMEASALLAGHVRPGAWMAIEVRLRNDGPPISGELRLAGGSSGKTRFGVAVDLPTQSDKRYVLYAQPPNFGTELEVALVSAGGVVATRKVGYQLHATDQTLIAVVADDAAAIIAGLDLRASDNRPSPATVALAPESLPDRVEGWAPLDRLVWQDVDSARLTPEQIEALGAWVASGGRLTIVGGTAGPGFLSAFPDDLLPYRPEATIDIAPETLVGLLGRLPDGAGTLPALSGVLGRGRALATNGDRTVAAEVAYGSGNVALIGIDPTIPWIAGTPAGTGLWQRLLPARAATGPAIADDSQILTAVSNVPTLALPPVGGLLLLLVGYILLIGPINYIVLRRIDRREWAWITMPALIVVFAAGAFAYGAYLRGSDILVNEVAIVRGAPGTPEGLAQAYYGIFSPGRGSYQVHVPGRALLSAPINGDFLGSPDGSASVLDVLQGDPSSVRDLAVAIGGFRVLRAESRVDAPTLVVDVRLQDGKLSGTVSNDSSRTLEDAAVILGSTIVRIGDLAAGETRTIDPTAIDAAGCCQPISDRLVGQLFSGIGGPSEESQRAVIRHYIVDQLTWDPNFGTSWTLPADGPVVVGWSSEALLPVEIEGHAARRTANVLYYIPASIVIDGTTRFRGDLMRSTVVASDAQFFSKDPWSIGFGRGTVTLAFRPIPFEGTLSPRRLILGPNFGPDIPAGAVTQTVAATGPAKDQGSDSCADPPCPEPSAEPSTEPSAEPVPPKNFDGLPEIELLDITTGTWMSFPHMTAGLYEIEDGARYIEPTSGEVLVRFLNEAVDQVGFSFTLEMEADIQ